MSEAITQGLYRGYFPYCLLRTSKSGGVGVAGEWHGSEAGKARV